MLKQSFKANIIKFSRRSRAVRGICLWQHFNNLDDVFSTAWEFSWRLLCEAVRSAWNNIKRLVIWCRSAEDVTVSNDLGDKAARHREQRQPGGARSRHPAVLLQGHVVQSLYLKTCSLKKKSKLEWSTGLEVKCNKVHMEYESCAPAINLLIEEMFKWTVVQLLRLQHLRRKQECGTLPKMVWFYTALSGGQIR